MLTLFDDVVKITQPPTVNILILLFIRYSRNCKRTNSGPHQHLSTVPSFTPRGSQDIALHASSAAINHTFLINFCLPGSFNFILLNPRLTQSDVYLELTANTDWKCY